MITMRGQPAFAAILILTAVISYFVFNLFRLVLTFLPALKSESEMAEFDPHTTPHNDVTSGQLTFFIIWCGCLFTWICRFMRGNRGSNNVSLDEESEEKKEALLENGNLKAETKAEVTLDVQNGDDKTEQSNGTEKVRNEKKFTAPIPVPTFDEFLLKVVQFGVIMIYFYLCDYRKVFPMEERVYSRDTFLFLVFLLFLIGCAFTMKPTKDIILNRDQTEEWKGWMQVMFVWYHVFAAKEWYNWIRVYIAAYVWMTGFGNFSFFWVRKDYSLWRVLKMQFRLNFLVTCLCVVTDNEYMLYYICAMHSYWFITVYVFMGTMTSWNTQPKKMAVKFLVYFLCNALIFEVPVITDNIFRPLWFILQYHDERFGLMHEWSFRAGLDHWACFVGMLCAYNYPHFESFMKNVEKNDVPWKRIVPKVVMVAVGVIVLAVWYALFMGKDKFAYNASHPYTSMIPLICFIVIRNAFPLLRQYYVGMFAWLGKITLETYLSQLHIYLQSNAKHLIGYIAGYPLLNFALSTVIYLPVSYILFNLTTDFSAYLIPKDMKAVVKNALTVAVIFLVPYTMISFFHVISTKLISIV